MTTQQGHPASEVPEYCETASDGHRNDIGSGFNDAPAMNGFRVEQEGLRRRIAASRRLPPLDNGVLDPVAPNGRMQHGPRLVKCTAVDRHLGVNGDRQHVNPALDYWHVTFMDRGLAEREAAGRRR